jgi:hypothetical protein
MDRLSKLRRDLVKEFKVDMQKLTRDYGKSDRDHALIDMCLSVMKNSLQQIDNRANFRSTSVRNLHSNSLETTFLRNSKQDKATSNTRDPKIEAFHTERSSCECDNARIMKEMHGNSSSILCKEHLDTSQTDGKERVRMIRNNYLDSSHNISTQISTARRAIRSLERQPIKNTSSNIYKDTIYRPKRPISVPRSNTRLDLYKPVRSPDSKYKVPRNVRINLLKALHKVKRQEDKNLLLFAFKRWKKIPASFQHSKSSISLKRGSPSPLRKQFKKKTETQVLHETLLNLVKKGDIRGIKSITHKLSLPILNARDSLRNTAIYYSAVSGNILILTHLWSLGAKLNMRCESNNTELHAGFKSGSIEVVLFLLQKGSDLNVFNDEDLTPLDYANERMRKILGIEDDIIGKIIPTDIVIRKLSCGKVHKNKPSEKIKIQASKERSPSLKPASSVLSKMCDYSPLYISEAKSGLHFRGQKKPSISLEASLIKYAEIEDLKPEFKLFKSVDIKKAGSKEYLAVLSLQDDIDTPTLKAQLSELTFAKLKNM